jgi:hypothetical protein
MKRILAQHEIMGEEEEEEEEEDEKEYDDNERYPSKRQCLHAPDERESDDDLELTAPSFLEVTDDLESSDGDGEILMGLLVIVAFHRAVRKWVRTLHKDASVHAIIRRALSAIGVSVDTYNKFVHRMDESGNTVGWSKIEHLADRMFRVPIKVMWPNSSMVPDWAICEDEASGDMVDDVELFGTVSVGTSNDEHGQDTPIFAFVGDMLTRKDLLRFFELALERAADCRMSFFRDQPWMESNRSVCAVLYTMSLSAADASRRLDQPRIV